ncbi:MAG: hypothetical protein K2X32_13260 [Phycisphaerales bacterium]|nr:hypothetical protein [Phycisphaerales bacterium]
MAIETHFKSYGVQWLAYNRGLDDPRFEPVTLLDEYVTEIHALARGKFYEEELWSELLTVVPSPLPLPVAHDLVTRNIGVTSLGHRYEHEAILWRVADQVVEAVYNLAIRRYENEHDGPDRLEEIFYQFPYWLEIGEMLAYRSAGTPEKLEWFVARMKEHKLPLDQPRRESHWNPEFRELMLKSEGTQ